MFSTIIIKVILLYIYMDLSNGDLILVKESHNFLSRLKNRELDYIHIGIIVRDPSHFFPSLKGLFVISGYKTYNNSIAVFNIELIPIEDFLKKFSVHEIIIRKLKTHITLSQSKLFKNYKTIYDYPLGIIPMEWYPYLDRKPVKRKANRSWSATVVGYLFTKCGIINNLYYTKLLPKDFSQFSRIIKKISEIFEDELNIRYLYLK
jgi:hypothetical protein